MAFYPAVQGDTTSAYYMNSNFEHIAEGDRLPREGVSLTSVSNKYNLGRQHVRWEEIHVVDLNIESFVTNCWNKLTEITLSATSSYTSIEGLNGDNINNMMILFRLKSQDTIRAEVKIKVNSSTTDNYHNFYMGGQNNTVIKGHSIQSGTTICVAQRTLLKPTNTSGFAIVFMNTKTGHYRNGIIYRLDGGRNTTTASAAYSMRIETFTYQSKDDTITSIQFMTAAGEEMASQTSIQIWGSV